MINPRQAFAYGPKTGAEFLRFFWGDMGWSGMIPFLAHAHTIDPGPTQDLCVGWITSGTQLLKKTHLGAAVLKRPRRPENWLIDPERSIQLFGEKRKEPR